MLSEKTLSLQKNKYNSKISINDETEHYDAKNVVTTFGYILLFPDFVTQKTYIL